MTYPETLRCAWRLTWPLAILATLSYYVAIAGIKRGYLPNPITFPYLFTAFIILNSSATFFLLPGLVKRRFRGFSLIVSDGSSDYADVPLKMRTRMWAWIVTRETLACAIGWFLLGPLALVLSLIGVHQNGLVLVLAFTFGVRPLMVKLLVENDFSGFHLELRRP